jgi:predicted nucleic acid-binding protein
MIFLLDTNVISEIRKRDRAHPNVSLWVHRTPVREIGTSVVVLAEIRRGIELKRRNDVEQAEGLDRWFWRMRTRLGDRVLPVDEPIAEAWARLSVPDPLPLIDGLLAATAKVRGLTLVTRNIADVMRTGVSILDPFSG